MALLGMLLVMSAIEEIDRYLADHHRPRMRSISIKASDELIERTKAVAAARGVPYQTLIKALWETGLRQLELSLQDSKHPSARKGRR
jgi:hypothetical protein